MALRACNVKRAPNCTGTVTRHSKTGSCFPCSQFVRRKDGKESSAVAEGLTVHGETAEVVTKTNERVRSLADLIRVCQIDTTEWDVERWVANKWEVGAKDAAKEIRVTPLFQVKAWLRRKTDVIMARAEIEAMLADARTQAPPRRAPALVKQTGDAHFMLEPSIPDLHLGKLAWSEETGYQNYDSRIAVEDFQTALDMLLVRASSFRFEEVVFPIGQDFFNADNLANTTTRGTVQDVDGRFQKMFRLGVRTVIAAVERLREIAPVVRIPVVRGNHDTLSAWFLGELLATHYAKTPSVRIDNAPNSRKYVEYHRNMLMLTHGDKGRRPNYPLLMATEQPEMFGRTVHREAHTGHLHQLRVQEHHGVKVRISPALCSADAWHSDNQYVGNARAAEAFVWHRTEGIVSIATYTVPN
jgi:hypothetical protein